MRVRRDKKAMPVSLLAAPVVRQGGRKVLRAIDNVGGARRRTQKRGRLAGAARRSNPTRLKSPERAS
ncbi:MAG: hypothetical protein DLM68_16475 [Hyphomicrobiales bacterium]|nr:MAG: hypothetical protein DLM68_16475 [Hyphomicrobiales bacterium]